MITLAKIQDLYENANRLRFYLDDIDLHSDRTDVKENIQKLMESIRKIAIATILQNKQTICITGLQGVGKSTFVKTMYELPDGILHIGTEIGEKVPIIISEEKNLDKPQTFKVVLQKNETTKKYEEKHIPIQQEEFCQSSGNTNTTEAPLYMELKLPEKIIKNQKTCFMLLPGFERTKDYWRELLTFSVSCSDSCIFAMTEEKLASTKNDDIIAFVSEKIGFEKMVFAITHSEYLNEVQKTEIRNTVKKRYKSESFEDDRIIFTNASNLTWLEELKNALEKYIVDNHSYTKHLNEEMLKEIEKIDDIRFCIKETINNHIDDNNVVCDNNVQKYLNWYMEVINIWRKNFEIKLNNSLEKAKVKSREKIKEELKKNRKEYYQNGMKRRLFGNGIEDLDRAQKLVDKALKEDTDNIYLFKIAFTDAIGQLLKESVTTKTVGFVISEDKKENRFLINDNKTKEKKSSKIIEIQNKEIKEKAKRICKDVSTLTLGPSNTGTNELVYREDGKQVIQMAVQSQVFEFSKQILSSIEKNESEGLKLLEITNLKETVIKVKDFETSLNSAYKGVDNAVKTFNNMYGFMCSPEQKNLDKSKHKEDKSLSDTAKTGIGIAAIAAVDYIPDASVNFLPGILEAMGLSAEAAACAVAGIIAAVLAVAEIRTARADLIDFQNQELAYIDNTYDTLKYNFLDQFDKLVIEKNYEILKTNLEQIFGTNEKMVAYFNVQSVLHTIKENLKELKIELENDSFRNNFS